MSVYTTVFIEQVKGVPISRAASVTVRSAVDTRRNLSGSVALGAVGASGVLTLHLDYQLSGAVDLGSVLAEGDLLVDRPDFALAGDIALAGVSASGTLTFELVARELSGEVALGAVGVTGQLHIGPLDDETALMHLYIGLAIGIF